MAALSVEHKKHTNCPASDVESREVIWVGGDYRTLNMLLLQYKQNEWLQRKLSTYSTGKKLEKMIVLLTNIFFLPYGHLNISFDKSIHTENQRSSLGFKVLTWIHFDRYILLLYSRMHFSHNITQFCQYFNLNSKPMLRFKKINTMNFSFSFSKLLDLEC